MSLLDTPSPMARIIAPDPKLWGERVAARQARRSGHPSARPARIYDQDLERTVPTLALFVTPFEAQTIISALNGSPYLQSRELAVQLREQVAGRDAVWTDTDPTLPHGIDRPDGA